MFSRSQLILTVPPGESRAAAEFGLPLGHLSYRIGPGGHLFRANTPAPPKGGYMVVDDTGFDGRGDPPAFCHELLRECSARGFQGVLCTFSPHPLSLLGSILSQLEELLDKRGLSLAVSEGCASFTKRAAVLIPSALSGGSLSLRLTDAAEHWGAGRILLQIQRLVQDFFLPSPGGQGLPLSQEELQALKARLSPSVFFSDELCAHYFTYMSPSSGAHFILFDDAGSIRKKLLIASNLGLAGAVLGYRENRDLLPYILPDGH